jgi:hypothetical protein
MIVNIPEDEELRKKTEEFFNYIKSREVKQSSETVLQNACIPQLFTLNMSMESSAPIAKEVTKESTMTKEEKDEHDRIEVDGLIGIGEYDELEHQYKEYLEINKELEANNKYTRDERKRLRSINPNITDGEINEQLEYQIYEYKCLIKSRSAQIEAIMKSIDRSIKHYTTAKKMVENFNDKSVFINIKDKAMSRLQHIFERIDMIKNSVA